jgi:hypothetical protein
MPIIAPPPDTVYQEETTSSEATPDRLKEWEQYRRIQIYINVNNWICPVCSSTVFGRCKRCPYCWGRCGGRVTLRPADFKLRRTDV